MHGQQNVKNYQLLSRETKLPECIKNVAADWRNF